MTADSGRRCPGTCISSSSLGICIQAGGVTPRWEMLPHLCGQTAVSCQMLPSASTSLSILEATDAPPCCWLFILKNFKHTEKDYMDDHPQTHHPDWRTASVAVSIFTATYFPFRLNHLKVWYRQCDILKTASENESYFPTTHKNSSHFTNCFLKISNEEAWLQFSIFPNTGSYSNFPNFPPDVFNRWLLPFFF